MRYFFVIFLLLIGFTGIAFAQSTENKEEISGILAATTSNTMYHVPYLITSGTVDEITPFCNSVSVVTLFTSDNMGRLTLDIPRNMMDAKYKDVDEELFVLLDGEEIEFEETSNNHSREVTIHFEPGSHELEIATTWILTLENKGSACKTIHEPPYSYILPPLKQMKNNIHPQDVICEPNLVKMQKTSLISTASCVKPSSIEKLIERGWSDNFEHMTSSYMDRTVPTLDDFKNTLSEPYNIDTIFSKFGEPHDDIGSGIHIYVYKLNDLTEIWIGYADDILYVKHIDAHGNEARKSIDKKDRIKNNIWR